MGVWPVFIKKTQCLQDGQIWKVSIGNEKSAYNFSDRSSIMDVCKGNACFFQDLESLQTELFDRMSCKDIQPKTSFLD